MANRPTRRPKFRKKTHQNPTKFFDQNDKSYLNFNLRLQVTSPGQCTPSRGKRDKFLHIHPIYPFPPQTHLSWGQNLKTCQAATFVHLVTKLTEDGHSLYLFNGGFLQHDETSFSSYHWFALAPSCPSRLGTKLPLEHQLSQHRSRLDGVTLRARMLNSLAKVNP